MRHCQCGRAEHLVATVSIRDEGGSPSFSFHAHLDDVFQPDNNALKEDSKFRQLLAGRSKVSAEDTRAVLEGMHSSVLSLMRTTKPSDRQVTLSPIMMICFRTEIVAYC